MKAKPLFQVLVVFVLLFSSVGSARASPLPDTLIITRDLSTWNATYFVFFRDSLYTLRHMLQIQPSASTTVSPAIVNVGETATATVSLDNVPAEGYTGAEFVCTYNPGIMQAGNIVVTNLFGADAAVAINGPQNGSFIVAIAGSNGNRVTTSGAAFTFGSTALQTGQSPLQCTVRVSEGGNVLTGLPSSGTTLTVAGSPPTATFTPTNSPTPASETPTGSPTPVSSTPTETASPTSETPSATASPTSFTPVETATASITPTSTFTATATPVPNGTLTGKVLAGKPVTVSLYSGTTLVTSTGVDQNGDFSLTALAGSYTVVATASGFLTAQGSAGLTGGSTTTKPDITLLAGDIDGNNVIDQFDALTIGMNYNATTPSAADLNNDGVINVLDLELLAANYHATGPLTWETSYP